MKDFSKAKTIVVAREINNPSFLIDKEKLEKIKKRTQNILQDKVFWIEKLLQIVYKERKKLKLSLDKGEDLPKIFQIYLDNVLAQYNSKIIFNWLYWYIENDDISKLENIVVSKKTSHENIFEELRRIKNNNSKIILPIYRLIKKNNKSNMKWYLSVDIKKWSYEKIFFLLNVIFWCLHDVINELFESKYKDITKESISDILTWTYTRKCFQEKLKADLLNKKENEELHIMFTDIDNFKNVNDTFWHNIWDKVLKQFSWWIRKSIRHGIDYVWRWWWEEFIIIFKFDKNRIDDDEDIKMIIEHKIKKIKKAIQPKNIEWIGKITFSWWITSTNEIKYDSFKDNIENILTDLINKADKKMYKAKTSWKNKVNFE